MEQLTFPQTLSWKRKTYSDPQLALIRKSLARQCNDAEFDEFMAVAFDCGLDPLRRQIVPLFTAPDDPERRKLVVWTTIDGLRLIAARQGDYRPMESAAHLEYDAEKIDPETNPLGLVRAEVAAWKYRDGRWHPVIGEAWWDEHAPLRAEAPKSARGREQAPDAPGEAPDAPGEAPKAKLDPNWLRRGRILLSKCAEAQALRRGWPDLLSGLYSEEETAAMAQEAMLASERVLRRALGESGRAPAAQTSAPHLWLQPDPSKPLAFVSLEVFAKEAARLVSAAQSAEAVDRFEAANRLSLAAFWDIAPEQALALKKAAEARRTELATPAEAPKPRAKRSGGRQRQKAAPTAPAAPSADGSAPGTSERGPGARKPAKRASASRRRARHGD